ncbi:MAG: hypothetical protein QGH75_03830, partial [Pseudomonadales bacterium]|nr:hypothetical protein [Pseudomonadales bacterium]
LPRIDGFSKSRSRWPLGAIRREWLVLSKSRNNVDDGFSACPKGAYQISGPPRPIRRYNPEKN